MKVERERRKREYNRLLNNESSSLFICQVRLVTNKVKNLQEVLSCSYCMSVMVHQGGSSHCHSHLGQESGHHFEHWKSLCQMEKSCMVLLCNYIVGPGYKCHFPLIRLGPKQIRPFFPNHMLGRGLSGEYLVNSTNFCHTLGQGSYPCLIISWH